ncbi:MAG: DNA translocase FtsK [Treponemataceae bacterium]
MLADDDNEVLIEDNYESPAAQQEIVQEEKEDIVFLNLKRDNNEIATEEIQVFEDDFDENELFEQNFSDENDDTEAIMQETLLDEDMKNAFEEDFSVGNETFFIENDTFENEIITEENLISVEESLSLNSPFVEQEIDDDNEIDLSVLNFAENQTIAEDEKKKTCPEHIDPIIQHISEKQSYANYYVPTEGILNTYPDGEYWVIDSATQHAGRVLKETLSEFKIKAEVTGIRKGPVITMFEILPAPGVKLAKIVGLQDNIALRLAASSVRIVAPIPGKHAVGIEVPNKDRAIVSFKELIETDTPSFKKMEIPVVLGKDISGEAQLLDLASTPHLLIAGSTGAGKSVCVNSMILSILYKRSPQEVKMILIDPKIVELKLYNDIPHLLTPVITEPKKAFQALQYCLCEMERRYSLLDRLGVRDIKSYNRRIVERSIAQEKLPYIVVIIDEFADLMATTGKELESTVARLAAMSRAVGIHIVLATQRPSIDVITGLIKANIPSRIAFMVASKMDSRIIIDQMGAEKLLGKGDMLYASAIDPFPSRIQGTFVSEDEVEKVVEFVKGYGEPEYIDDEIFVDDEDEGIEPVLYAEGDDPLYDKALEIVVQAGKASASYIQRRLKIGYNRAARLVEQMEERGIVGPANGSKAREIIHMPQKEIFR